MDGEKFVPISVKRWISRGELDGIEKDADDIIESCGSLLDNACSSEVLGTVLFEGTDGKFYTVTLEAEIGEADPEFVKETLAEQGGRC